MKAIIHIGTPKTGTTTIQRFLAQNRSLLKNKGLYLPKTKDERSCYYEELFAATVIPDSWHPILSYIGHYIGSRVFGKDFTEKDQENLWKSIRYDIETNCKKNETVLFSCENYSHQTKSEVARLKDLLNSLFDEVTVVCYLRRQPEYIVSFYQTLTRTGMHLNFLDYVSQPEEHSILAYHNIVERWSVFGKEKIKVRVFDTHEFCSNDLLNDFAYTIGIDLTGLERTGKKNSSLSSAEVEFLRLLNFHIPPMCTPWQLNPEHKLIRRSIEAVTQKDQQGYHLTRSEAQHILDTCRQGNDWIAREYLGREKLFSEDVSMYPEEVASPHGLTLERCAEITDHLWKERCYTISDLQQKNEKLASDRDANAAKVETLKSEIHLLVSEKDTHVAEIQRLHGNLVLLQQKNSTYWHYYWYKVLAQLTFGKKRQHYQAKRDLYHDQVRQIRNFGNAR